MITKTLFFVPNYFVNQSYKIVSVFVDDRLSIYVQE